MDQSIIDRYIREMISMRDRATLPVETPPENETGGLIVSVTTLRQLYPVENATVTVFTGDIDNKNIIDTKTTDQSGKTDVFTLSAPPKSLSENSAETRLPFARYNILTEAEGFVSQINLNVPVFSGVISLQSADLILPSAAGEDKSTIVIDEMNNYDLGGNS